MEHQSLCRIQNCSQLYPWVPSQKLFAFGGDTGLPSSVLAYSIQARRGLTRALQEEVDEAYMSEAAAMNLAGKFMRENQYDYFGLAR